MSSLKTIVKDNKKGSVIEVTWFGNSAGLIKDYYENDDTIQNIEDFLLDHSEIKTTDSYTLSEIIDENILVTDDAITPISVEECKYEQEENGNIKITSRFNKEYLGEKLSSNDASKRYPDKNITDEPICYFKNIDLAFRVNNEPIFDLAKEREHLKRLILIKKD